MAKRRTAPKELPDAVRDTVDELVRGAEAGLTRSRRAVADAIDDRMPATHEDVRELKAELRAIGRRLDAIEDRLPAKRSGGRTAGKKRSGAKRS
jgi:hypothetical protein